MPFLTISIDTFIKYVGLLIILFLMFPEFLCIRYIYPFPLYTIQFQDISNLITNFNRNQRACIPFNCVNGQSEYCNIICRVYRSDF